MQNDNAKLKTPLKDRTYNYSIQLIRFLDSLPKDSSMETLKNQLVRSATSIGANIIEAQASSSRKDFINFFTHSLKSANESSYWLGLLKDAKRVEDPQLTHLLQETKRAFKYIRFKHLDFETQE